MRRVNRLQQAERLVGWPEIIPRSRPRGVKALGHRYEAAVAKRLGADAKRGVWWSYRDANGPGLCQTDFIIIGEIWAVILECKHTWTTEGMEQLNDLYLPVVEMATSKKVLGVQVCKHLVPHHTGPVYADLSSAVTAARSGEMTWPKAFHPTRTVTLHWRGLGPLITTSKEYSHVHVLG